MTKPSHFPCFVVRFMGACYYTLPVFVIRDSKDLPRRLPEIFRIAVVNPARGQDPREAAEALLYLALQSEARFIGRNTCLVMNKDHCYNYNISSGEIKASDLVPFASVWMQDSFFLNTVAGPVGERDQQLAKNACLRIYCNHLNDVGADIIEKVCKKGFIPSVIPFNRGVSEPIAYKTERVSWLKRMFSKFTS